MANKDLMRAIERAALGRIYGLVMALRSVYWRLRRPLLVGVRALVVREREVLLIRHRAGRTPWALPGGGVERYERLEEAVRREAREESGVPVTVLHLLGVYDRLGQGVSNYIGVFVCAPHGEPNPPRSLEIAEARFFALDALPERLDPGSRRRIAEYAGGERGLARDW